jgi:hypothetical protein
MPATGKTFATELDIRLDPAWRRDKLKLVAFVQQSGQGAILAAKQSPLPP